MERNDDSWYLGVNSTKTIIPFDISKCPTYAGNYVLTFHYR